MLRRLYEKYKEIIRYLVVGALTTVVSLASYYLCVWTFLDANDALQLQIANVLSWIAAVSFAYVTNRVFVFQSKNKNTLKEAISFVGARVTSLLIDMGSMFVMVTLLHLSDDVAKLIVQVIVLVLNYLLSKFFVFRRQKDAGETKETEDLIDM